jgi:hypothetical protein
LIKEARDRQRRRRQRLSLLGVALALGIGGIGYVIERATSSGHRINGCAGANCAAAAVRNAVGAQAPLYGFTRSYAAPSTLGQVSPTTLKLHGRTLRVPEGFTPAALDPDGRQLLLLNALAPTGRSSGEPALSIVNLTDLRVESGPQPRLDDDLSQSRVVTAAWPSAHQILVVAQRFGRRRWRRGPRVLTAQDMLAINPSSGAVKWRRKLSTSLAPTDSATVGHTTILLLQAVKAELRGRATVIAASPGGVLRSSSLTLTQAGYGSYPAALVVTAGTGGRHSYVLSGGGKVYSIDPATAQATLHRVTPPADTPATSPPDLLLDAAPLGSNIAASGFFPRPAGPPAAGIFLIDTKTWAAKLLDPKTPEWFTAGSSLVTFTQAGQFRSPAAWKTKGTGITIYNANGAVRRHLYGTQAFVGVTALPGYDAAILPGRPGRITPPGTPAEHRARDAAIRLHELLFNPATGQTLGSRTAVGQPPALLRTAATAAHR